MFLAAVLSAAAIAVLLSLCESTRPSGSRSRASDERNGPAQQPSQPVEGSLDRRPGEGAPATPDPGDTIMVRVIDDARTPVQGADLFISNGNERSLKLDERIAVTDGEDVATLSAALLTAKPGVAAAASGLVTAFSPIERLQDGIELVLERGATVRVECRTNQDLAVSGATVTLSTNSYGTTSTQSVAGVPGPGAAAVYAARTDD